MSTRRSRPVATAVSTGIVTVIVAAVGWTAVTDARADVHKVVIVPKGAPAGARIVSADVTVTQGRTVRANRWPAYVADPGTYRVVSRIRYRLVRRVGYGPVLPAAKVHGIAPTACVVARVLGRAPNPPGQPQGTRYRWRCTGIGVDRAHHRRSGSFLVDAALYASDDHHWRVGGRASGALALGDPVMAGPYYDGSAPRGRAVRTVVGPVRSGVYSRSVTVPTR